MNEIKAAKTPLRLPRLGDIAPSVLLFLAARASALDMLPFGTALFAAAYDKSTAYLGIIAVCLGTASAAGAAAVPKYLTAVIIFLLFTRMCKKHGTLLRSAACGASILAGGLVMLFVDYGGMYELFLLVLESLSAMLMYIVFRKSRILADERFSAMSAEEYVSAAVTVGVLIAGTGGIELGAVRVCNVLAVYAILITALSSGAAVSGCTGLCIGFMSAMASSDCIVMMGIYGMSAVFASFLTSCRKIGCALGFVCGAAVTFIYAKNRYDIPMSMLDVFIGTALFLVTPSVVSEYFKGFFNRAARIEFISPGLRMREYIMLRLNRAAEAFGSLYESFMAVSEGRLNKFSGDIGTILDETTDRVCRGCRMCGKCWQTDFRRTYKNVLGLISTIESEGGLTGENIPEHFCERCVRTDMFIYELNHVYELYRRDLLRRSDAVTTRNLISTQYNELRNLFTGMAADIEDGFCFLDREEERIVEALERADIAVYEVSVVEGGTGSCEVYLRLPPVVRHDAVEGIISEILNMPMGYDRTERGLSRYASKPNFECETAVLQLPCDNAEVNGDSVTIFKGLNGRLFAIAADGMGSGAEAKYESASALRLLTGFLKAGFSVKTALGMLNSSMCLNMDNEIYSTIDLLSLNLYTGEAELYKIGSAETVISCGDEIRVVSSHSAPVGIISSIRPDKRAVKLSEGDVVLMMTDGVTEAGYSVSRADWIRQLAAVPAESMETLARTVMDTALAKNRGRAKDDMSVIAIRVRSV